METAAALPRSSRTPVIIGGLLTVALLGGLLAYKWSGSLAAVSHARLSHTVQKPIAALSSGQALASTLLYFKSIWIALAFGIGIGAAVRVLVSPIWLQRLLRGRSARRQVTCAIAGSPLMLCSCCVSPVFSGVYESGGGLGPSLGLMLASPGLNVAALVLTFALFPLRIALARLVLALLAVLALAPLVGRWFGRGLQPPAPPADESPPSLARYLRELGRLTLMTLPMIVLGVVLSSLVLPAVLHSGRLGGLPAVAAVAVPAVLVALPTFFEIPLAVLLAQLGAPAGVTVAVLFAGPIVNLPSLLVVGCETRPRVAIALGAGVALLAWAGGAVVSMHP